MIVLTPFVHETIWGGERLAEIAGVDSNNVGHLYSLCCEKGLETLIANGPYKGQNFHTYFEKVKDKFGLSCYREFPLIIALVEAKDDLSIQVHPNDEYAISQEKAEYGKNESWYFLEAPEMGGIYNGCLVDDVDSVKEKIEQDDLMSIVDVLPVKKGDYVYVEAGTVHALARGSYLYEIEENSPWTYRMFDYNRIDANGNKRDLHIEKALSVVNPQLKSEAKQIGTDPVQERRYSVQKFENISDYTNESITLECITLIDGECKIDDVNVKTGYTIVLEPDETICGNFKTIIIARPR